MGNSPLVKVDPLGLAECVWGGFSGGATLGAGVQIIKQVGKCCGKWKNRNCLCACVGISIGGCGGIDFGDDSTENKGWGIGIGWVCIGNSGAGAGVGWKYGAQYCWCECSISDI